jgi:Tol biopolymer transport system component
MNFRPQIEALEERTVLSVQAGSLASFSLLASSGNGPSSTPSVSADGRFAAFQSDASNLVANDTNNATDVFVRDVQAGTTTLVSVNKDGTGSGNGASFDPTITPDGRFVVFLSLASDLVSEEKVDSPFAPDVFVRDLQTGRTTLVSVNSKGNATGNADSFASGPDISSDGRFVAFQSDANDLVDNDNNNATDIFVRDLRTGTTHLVSVNLAGTGSGNGASLGPLGPVISADGRFVAFVSFATNLVSTPKNGASMDVFVRDLMAGTTTLVSVDSAGTASGNSDSRDPVLSADGEHVAFVSSATDLVAIPDANGFNDDVFVRDLQTGTTTLVSVNSAGTASSNGFSDAPSISADGRFVAFESAATDLVPGFVDGNGALNFDAFVRDLQTGTTTLLSINSAGTASGNAGSFLPVVSADDQHVLFVSDATDLVNIPDNNGLFGQDIFVRDLQTLSTTLVTINSAGTATGNGSSGAVAFITPDGRFVVFQSDASDLVANDFNGTTDAFERDLQTATTTLISVSIAGTASVNTAGVPLATALSATVFPFPLPTAVPTASAISLIQSQQLSVDPSRVTLPAPTAVLDQVFAQSVDAWTFRLGAAASRSADGSSGFLAAQRLLDGRDLEFIEGWPA